MNEVTLTVSIKYKTAEQTIRRLPSKVSHHAGSVVRV